MKGDIGQCSSHVTLDPSAHYSSPDFDPEAQRAQGRFAMLCGQGRSDNDDGDIAFNVAVFREFVPEDAEADAEPLDLDYFYGHFESDGGDTIDLLDWLLTGNICETDPNTCFKSPAAGEDESLDLRAAFFNRGIGRGEATISGGDLSQDVAAAECWDQDIDRTYLSVSVAGAVVAETGECAEPLAGSLEELGLPSLDEVDVELLNALDCVATNGIEACED